jgi:hypothetical protein
MPSGAVLHFEHGLYVDAKLSQIDVARSKRKPFGHAGPGAQRIPGVDVVQTLVLEAILMLRSRYG